MEEDSYIETSRSILNNYEEEIDVGERTLQDKSMQIQQLISHFEYRLLGYMWKSNAEKYYYTGKPLMGDESLKKVMLLLHPFSREVLMISNKQDYQWHKQVLRTRLSVIDLLTKATDVNVQNFKEIWRSFSNLMFNIGDIILRDNSRNFLRDYFNREKEDELLDISNKRLKESEKI